MKKLFRIPSALVYIRQGFITCWEILKISFSDARSALNRG